MRQTNKTHKVYKRAIASSPTCLNSETSHFFLIKLYIKLRIEQNELIPFFNIVFFFNGYAQIFICIYIIFLFTVFNFICNIKNAIISKSSLHPRLSLHVPKTFAQYCCQQVTMPCPALHQPTELAGEQIGGKINTLPFNISISMKDDLMYAYYVT